MPDGTGVWFGVNQQTFEAGHFARAAMEGVTLGMNYGLRRLAELGVKPTQIRATGGGAKSKVWRQIMADVFNAEVVTLKVSEGAAYGAALQALWCWRLQQGEKVSISDITDQFVELNAGETAEPNPEERCRLSRVAGHPGRPVPVVARRVPQASSICLALSSAGAQSHRQNGRFEPTFPACRMTDSSLKLGSPPSPRRHNALIQKHQGVSGGFRCLQSQVHIRTSHWGRRTPFGKRAKRQQIATE